MWGLGGRHYWGRTEKVKKAEGIVVMFAWMSSQDKHVNNYVQLYSSIGWDSLVLHSKFLNIFFPDQAEALALEIVDELVQELKLRPCPVVFASFSGGTKACMYKVLRIIQGAFPEQKHLDNYRLIRECLSGHIFDSTPIDFVSEIGTRFVLNPAILKTAHPPRMVSWIAKGISSSLDAVFLSGFEAQRAEYWQTLYSTVSTRAPYLIFCSEDDELAPVKTIFNFGSRLKDMGADVRLVKWNKSSHVGHFRNHPVDYRKAVSDLLAESAFIYSQKTRQFEAEKMGTEGTYDEISDPFSDLRKAAANSSQSFQRISLDLSDHFVVPGTLEYHQDRDVGSISDERKERYIPFTSPPVINANGVLGHMLFDACVPNNVEDWDLRSSSSRRALFTSGQRQSSCNPVKCIRRSRL